MGTAEVQGELWGAKAEDWADVQEPTWRPVYETLFARAGLSPGNNLLDIGCGAGGALVLARDLGADVCGLDAAGNLVAIARERLPDARIEIGEMEQLPFDDATFDLVTSFNAFQFAGNIEEALREAKRVARPRGKIAMLVWGRKESCDLLSGTLPAVLALLPQAPGGVAPPAFAEPGVMESLMERAGLSPLTSGEFACEFRYPDKNRAWRAISSAGILVRVVRQVGEAKVRDAVMGTLQKFTRPDGFVVHRNTFRWLVAQRN